MDQFDNFACESRYCPVCGTKIFCRIDSGDETLYFVSEAMDVQVQACPECQLDLIAVPIHVLDVQPKSPRGKKGRGAKIMKA